MAGIDMNRTTAGVVLPASVSNEIWAKAVESSSVMQVSRRLPNLPPGGEYVHIIDDDGSAEWVGETEEKPVSNMTLSNKLIKAYKVARILTFSNEFRRDLPALYNEIVPRAAESLGRLFDQTVFGYHAAPGSNFDTLTGAPTEAFDNPSYELALGVMGTIALNGGDLSAWILSIQGQIAAMSATNPATGMPVFPGGTNLAGAPVVKSSHVYNDPTGTGATTVGFAGSWATDAAYGVVAPVTIRISDQATLKVGSDTISLWQRNMFAVLLEAEYGFRVSDDSRFVRLTTA